jgi:putative transcriptional regulator
MTKGAFDKIKAGLEDAKAYLDDSADKRRYRIHVPTQVNVKKIRTRLGLSQESFAETYGFALSAVRDWEQGRRQPERSARILLRVVEREPKAVMRALARTARASGLALTRE